MQDIGLIAHPPPPSSPTLVPHIRRFRYASKGLAVAPMRFIDPNDDWTDALIEVEHKARSVGKSVALHTHFNHANEFSWVTEAAAQKLHAAGVTVRNQTVLLKGVNDSVQAMSDLIRKLADNNVTPVRRSTYHVTPPFPFCSSCLSFWLGMGAVWHEFY
jgi:L-lysine 2,3-aminomutase